MLVGDWGQLPKPTHILGSHVNQKAIRAYVMGKIEMIKVSGISHYKASLSNPYSVSANALHFCN